MVVKLFKQPSNIQKTYKNQLCWTSQKSKFSIFRKIPKICFFNFKENRKNRCLAIFGFFIFWEFWISHCLGSHARGHYFKVLENIFWGSRRWESHGGAIRKQLLWRRRLGWLHQRGRTCCPAPQICHFRLFGNFGNFVNFRR